MSSVPRPIRLTVYQPNLSPLKLDVDSSTISLGRATDCTVPIKDRYLSRKHAEIVYASGAWVVRDCGSVNGTMLNGSKLTTPVQLRPGDRIGLGDSEVVFELDEMMSHSQLIALDSSSHAKSIVVPLRDAVAVSDNARAGVLASLAVEFIEDRSMSELFDFILARVMDLMSPSRAALALLGKDGKSFDNVRLQRRDNSDSNDLLISKTLLGEVIEERNVVSFVEGALDERLARAESIVAQQIRSAVCAPLIVGDAVLGVLYLDFLATRGAITHDDVRFIAQIARFAAVKLETTRLRDESIAKAKMDEELRTAYVIQSRLLPAVLPSIEGYGFAATNKPCRTVSGDYYDVIARPDGRIYFIIADVSGKGITAALVMTSLATAFNIFLRSDPSPAELVREINLTLAPKTSPTKFVTLVVGRLDPTTGVVDFTNAGHVPPLVVSKDGVRELKTTDMVVGLFEHASYRDQSVSLQPGDALVLFTDGVTEAENEAEEQLGVASISNLVGTLHGADAPRLLDTVELEVRRFTAGAASTDDVTMLALARRG